MLTIAASEFKYFPTILYDKTSTPTEL